MVATQAGSPQGATRLLRGAGLDLATSLAWAIATLITATNPDVDIILTGVVLVTTPRDVPDRSLLVPSALRSR